ncbi:MAG: polyribonucleotide nucleotidyltransferase, partial [Alphaproteobacteria bacterium]|nr:polyribonucleotide nucleotidyltransferase [Alphaproteobacteria bacterium]
MFNIHRETIEWGGRTLTLETGKVARQADGAVLVTYGETIVLATVVGAPAPREGVDFFPLTVNYQERYYAAGKIPGGYFKRERAPTERETLISRLIDRPIRPLFAEGYRNETQVVAQVLSHDLESDPDVVALVAASAALTLSGIPFLGPIGAARVGYIDGEYRLNPPIDDMPNSALDLVVAGTADAVLMVESEAKELPEQVMLGAVMFGHKGMQPVIDAIIRLAERAAKEPRSVPVNETAPLLETLKSACGADLAAAFHVAEKHLRRDRIAEIRARAAEQFVGEGEGKLPANKFGNLFHDLEANVMRNAVLDTGRRIDGRDLKTVRPIVAEVGALPRTHGSALFTRGET